MEWFFCRPNVEKLLRKEDIKGLTKALQYKKDAYVRQKAAEALGIIEEKSAIDALIAAIKDENTDVRCKAVEALGYIGDSLAVEPLITVLMDEGSKVRAVVVEALDHIGIDKLLPVQQATYYIYTKNPEQARKIGEPALEPSIVAINDKDRGIRAITVELIGSIGGPKAKTCLLTALKNMNLDEFIRRDIAEMLEKMDYKPSDTPELIDCWIEFEEWEKLLEVGELAKNSLIATMKDKNSDNYVRLNIAKILMKIGLSWTELADTVEPAVASLVADIKDNDKYMHMLTGWVEALGWKGNETAVEPLISALESNVFHTTDREDKIRAIAKTLGKIGDSRAVDPLISLLEDISGPHEPISALGEIGDEKAIEPLIEIFKNNIYVRKTVIEALTKIGVPQETKETLMATLISDHMEDKSYTNECLELLGWKPKTEEEKIDYYLAKEDISSLKKIGRPAIDRMIDLFRKIPHIPASEELSSSGSYGSKILVCLGEMNDKVALKVLIKQLNGRSRFCKVARDVLNRGKSYEEEYCLCPKCYTYMGVRNHLRSKGTHISEQMKHEALQNKIAIIGNYYSRCPGCRERILV